MNLIEKLKNEAINTEGISTEEALELFIEGSNSPFRIMAAASEIREHFKGKEIILCGITNAKSGRCSEDCKFCSQSAHYPTNAPSYPLKSAAEMIIEADGAARAGAEFFGIVTSGKRIKSKKEWNEIFKAIKGHQQNHNSCLCVAGTDRYRKSRRA